MMKNEIVKVKRNGLIRISCPICRKRLMDSREGVVTYVSPIDEDDAADYFAKCKHCGRVIGIRRIS